MKIRRFTYIYMTILLAGIVAMMYMLYILDLKEVFRDAYKICKLGLLLVILLGIVMYRISINRVTIVPIIYALYTFIIAILNGSDLVNTILTLWTWPLLFVVCYSFTSKTNDFSVRVEKLKRLLTGMTILWTLSSFPLIQRHLTGRGRAGEVIFPVYYFLPLIGLILLVFPKDKKKLIIPALMIVASVKRTGFLILVIGVFLAQIAELHITGHLKERRKQMIGFALMIMMSVAAFIFISDRYDWDIIARLQAISVDGGSGRIGIWRYVYERHRNSDFVAKLLGHGFQAVSRLRIQGRGILAHNDYLEILYDYGIIGFIMALIWTLQIVWYAIVAWKEKLSIAPSYSYSLCCFLLLALFSYLMIQSDIMNFLACYFGMAIGMLECERKKDNSTI